MQSTPQLQKYSNLMKSNKTIIWMFWLQTSENRKKEIFKITTTIVSKLILIYFPNIIYSEYLKSLSLSIVIKRIKRKILSTFVSKKYWKKQLNAKVFPANNKLPNFQLENRLWGSQVINSTLIMESLLFMHPGKSCHKSWAGVLR